MKDRVGKHLKKDIHEAKESIKEDKKLMRQERMHEKKEEKKKKK